MNRKVYACVILVILGILFLQQDFFVEAKMKNDSNSLKNQGNDSPFGVLEFLHWNHQWNNYKYPDKKTLERAILLMKEAGVSWVRMDFLWDEIEPEQGKFEFGKYDELVNLLSQHNIAILGLLDYAAGWASPCGLWNYPPEDNRFFVNYAVNVINRYKDKIKYWEVWNEPDSRTYWVNQDGLKSYCRLLKDVYIAAKKVDADCKILNGGLTDGLLSVNRLYDNGAKDYFDILNIHIFESPLNPGSIHRVKAYPKLAYKIMQRNKDSLKKIWVTEIGCPGVKKSARVNNWWMGKNPTELKQARWVKDVYTILIENKSAEKIFWAFFRDCKEHWDNGVDYFGLVRWDFSKKPAFLYYKRCFESWRRISHR